MKFEDFIELHRGYDLPKKQRKNGQVPVIASTGINGTHNVAKIKGPGVVTGRSGSIGKVQYIKDDFWPLNTTLYVSDFKGNNPKFVAYWLERFDLKRFSSGSAVPTLNRNELANVEICVPNREEQDKIVAILEPFERKIELNQEINDNLLNLANTLFKHYFPDINTGTDKIGDYIKNFDKLRKPLSKKQRSEMPGKYRYIGATSVNDHIDKYNFDGIYLLLGEDGTVQDEYGFPILQYTFGKFWPNNHAHVLQGKNVSTEWLYLYFSQRNISGIVTGAVQKKVSQKNMNSLKFKLPDSQELKKFDKIIQPLFSKIRSTKLENYQLEELKRVLLTKLF
jgi:type I restriction enzyme S subunit